MKRNNMMILNFLCFLIYFNIKNAQNAAPAQAAHAQPVHVHATHAQSTKRPPILSKPKEEIVVRQNPQTLKVILWGLDYKFRGFSCRH